MRVFTAISDERQAKYFGQSSQKCCREKRKLKRKRKVVAKRYVFTINSKKAKSPTDKSNIETV